MTSSHFDMQKEQKGHGKHLGTLQEEIDALNKAIGALKGDFDNRDDGPAINVVEEIKKLKISTGVTNTTLEGVEGQLNSSVALQSDHHKRIILLEQSSHHHTDQLKHLQNTVGVEKKEVPPPPPLPVVTEPVIQKRQVPIAKRIIREGPEIMKRKTFVDVVKSASIKTKQQQYKDRLDDHERTMRETDMKLAETNKELHEKMGLRVKMLEAKMNGVVPDVDQLKAGMELTEEYWKGLSHGLRESHKMVAVDRELIAAQPRAPSSSRNKTLPGLSKTPRGGVTVKVPLGSASQRGTSQW